MVSDWLKTQKKPPRTNQIRAVLTMVFSKQRSDCVRKTTIEKLKKYSKHPNTLKSAFFWLNVNKIEENEPEKLKNTLLVTDQAKVKK